MPGKVEGTTSTVELGASTLINCRPGKPIIGSSLLPRLQLQCFQQAPSVLLMTEQTNGVAQNRKSTGTKSRKSSKFQTSRLVNGDVDARWADRQWVLSIPLQACRTLPCRPPGTCMTLWTSSELPVCLVPSPLTKRFSCHSPTLSRQVTLTSLQWSRQIASPPQDKRRPRAMRGKAGSCCCTQPAGTREGTWHAKARGLFGSARHVRYEPRPSNG